MNLNKLCTEYFSEYCLLHFLADSVQSDRNAKWDTGRLELQRFHLLEFKCIENILSQSFNSFDAINLNWNENFRQFTKFNMTRATHQNWWLTHQFYFLKFWPPTTPRPREVMPHLEPPDPLTPPIRASCQLSPNVIL